MARQIIARELDTAKTPQELADRVQSTLSRLCDVMTSLVGAVGFRAVYNRAAHVAFPPGHWASTARLLGDNAMVLPGLVAAAEKAAPGEIQHDTETLVETILSLFCNFIGEGLTFRLVQRTWPSAPGEGPSTWARGKP